MKNYVLLSLLCAMFIQTALAKEGMPTDNTKVFNSRKIPPRTVPAKYLNYLPNALSPQHYSSPSSLVALSSTMISKEEVEPNNTIATANPMGGNDVKVKGNITPNADIDYFSFTASAGDKVYVATQTSFSATGSSDSFLEIIRSNGTTVLESDDNDGSYGSNSSSIAGAVIPTSGTYYIKMRHTATDVKLLPYFLYFQLQAGSPIAESESNDSKETADVLPSSGWVSGNIASPADVDFYSVSLNAGDTIFLSLDLDPERDNTTWDGQVALGEFNGAYLPSNDFNTTSPNSEAFFLTVKTSGTYYVVVATSNGSSGTYQLSTSVLPTNNTNLTTYTSTNIPQTIPTGPGAITSTLNIPANKRIESLKVSINLTHTNIADLDVRLTSPSGNTVILFTDINAISPLNITLDDNAAIPIGSSPITIVDNIVFQLPYKYRLEWFKGQMSQGTWTLTIDDDTAGNGGTLNSWGIDIIEETSIAGTLTNIYSNDFETNDGGFTHSGSQDEWERGIPTFAPIVSTNSGTKCWKTDLDNTYNFNSNADLVSPNIYIPNLSTNSAYLTWAQKFQLAGADNDNDNAYVEIQEIGGSNTTKRVWQWLGASMIDKFYGSPNYTVNESAGWGVFRANVTEFAGKTIRIIFHIDSNSEGTNLAGWAIDDVTIFKTFCPATESFTSNFTGVYNRAVASNTITATNQVTTDIGVQAPSNITYQAGKAVILLPNFKADSNGGTVFQAQIGGCN